MVANLLRQRSLAQVRTLVESSFGNFMAMEQKEGLGEELRVLNVRCPQRHSTPAPLSSTDHLFVETPEGKVVVRLRGCARVTIT